MSVKERLRQFIEYKKVSVRAFEKSCGLSYGYVNNMRVSIQPDKVRNIAIQYPELNTGWLLTGEGQMLKDELSGKGRLVGEVSVTTAPLISQYAQVGYLAGYEDLDYLEEQPLYYATQKYTGASFVAFEVRGDSMDNGKKDAICHGDIVLGQGIPQDLWVNQLLTPRVFVVVHKVEGILLREVVEHNVEKGTITCSAFNPDRVRFPDMVLSLKEVLGVLGVKELKRGGF